MAGIAGIIAPGNSPRRQQMLGVMTQAMVRGDASAGTWDASELSLSLGWVASPVSRAEHFPIWNEARNVCLIFSGEEYSDLSELQYLKSKGHEFVPDYSSHLVHLYEEFGLKFLERLNGGFAGVLVDLREKKVLIFNDRYGLHRIHFHQSHDELYFSSEAKSLLKVLPSQRAVDLQGLGEFFSCGSVLQDRTLFPGIHLMPAGSVWTCTPNEGIRKDTYFKREMWENQPALSPTDYYESLKATWARALPRYLRSGEKAALSLTGGVDSRMVLAWAKAAPGTLPCYTFGGRYRDCEDVRLARRIADLAGQPHEVIQIGKEFLSDFPALAEETIRISDGSMEVIGAIDLYLQRKIRNVAPVRVVGTYGGEILRRLVVFKPMGLPGEICGADFAEAVRRASSTYAEELRGNRLSFTAFKQTAWHMASKFSIERSHMTLRMPYYDNDVVALAYQSPPELGESIDPALKLIEEGNHAFGRLPTDRGLNFHSVSGPARARHAWQQFTFKAEYAYDYGMPQSLARVDHYLAWLRLERLFLGRHKFHHFRVFYRDELADYVRAVLLDPRSLGRPYLNPGSVKAVVDRHTSGRGNHTLEIHKLLSLELLHRELIERN